MLPTAKDKEALIIDLLKKGYKTREITKMAHVSNTTVKKIRQKLTGEAKEEQEQEHSFLVFYLISANQFFLFEQIKYAMHLMIAVILDYIVDAVLLSIIRFIGPKI